jgi:hypothetical protein
MTLDPDGLGRSLMVGSPPDSDGGAFTQIYAFLADYSYLLTYKSDLQI